MEDLGSTSDDGVVVEVSQQKMPDELWAKILESVNDNSVTAFASTCTQLRRVQQRSGRKLATDLRAFGGKNAFYMHHQDFGAHNAHEDVYFFSFVVDSVACPLYISWP